MQMHKLRRPKTIRQLARERSAAYVTIKINTDYLPDSECDRVGCHSNSETQAVATADQIRRLEILIIEIMRGGAAGEPDRTTAGQSR